MKAVDMRLILSFVFGALTMRSVNLWQQMSSEEGMPSLVQDQMPPVRAVAGDRSAATNTTRASIPSVSNSEDTAEMETLNVLFGMVGNSTAFVSEFQIGLKSILLNAPLDQALHVHVITNAKAHLAVQDVVTQETSLLNSYWRNPLTITTYNVDVFKFTWKKFVRSHIRGNSLDYRVTLGGYYRLLAYKILPPQTYLYMDVDAIVTANLNDLVANIDSNLDIEQHLFLMARLQPCTGFMVINTRIFEKFWEYVDQLPDDKFDNGGDQKLTTMVMDNFPKTYGELPNHWNVHLGNGWRHRPHLTLNNFKQLAMLHFNGERSNTESFYTAGLFQYCERASECNMSDVSREQFDRSWGLADYYVRLPWSQVEFYGKAMVRKNRPGYKCVVRLVNYDKPDVNASSVRIMEGQ